MRNVDLWKTIKATKVSFIAIILFVAMSIGILLGLSWIGPGEVHMANDYYDEHKAADIMIQSSDILTFEDVNDVKNTDDVFDAEGIYQLEAHFSEGGEEKLISIISASENVNVPELLEGELPDEPDEIALDKETAEEFGYKIGDSIKLDSSLRDVTDEDLDALKEDEFTITGFVHNPLYISLAPGTSKGYSALFKENYYYYAVVDIDAFNDDVTGSGYVYSTILARSDSLRGCDRFSDDYSSLISGFTDGIKNGIDGAGDWIITDISSTMGYYTVLVSKDTGNKFGGIMAVFFFAIGLLVCFSTVLRIVEEEKRLIGTKLANGFTRGEVVSKYLRYVILAVTAGAVLGVLMGFGISGAGQKTSTTFMTFSGSYPYFDAVQILKVVLFEFAAMIVITLFASYRQSKDRITNLLTNAKENSALFNRLSKLKFVRRSSVSFQSFMYNISMDGSRVFATIVGMVGSMALLIGPISLLFNLLDTPRVQYDDIFRFDHTISYVSEDAREEIEDIVSRDGGTLLSVHMEDGLLERSDGSSAMVKLIASDNSTDFDSMIKLRDVESGDALSIDNEGAYLWYTEQRDKGVNAGDEISINSYDNGKLNFEVSGIYENHDSTVSRLFMTAEAYEGATGLEYEPNAFLASVSDEAAAEIAELDGVLNCSADRQTCEDFFSTMVILTIGVLALVLMLSAVIAFLILVNLNVQFVQEKKSELIVMRINGFSIHDTKLYIARDNILLSAVSVILGVAAGGILSGVLIDAMQMEGQYFMNRISVPACIVGSTISLLYMLITTLIAIKPINRLDLTDINKI